MFKATAIALLAALVMATPLAASAQSSGAPSAQQAPRHTGSYRSQMQKRRHEHRQRARAGAEHARQVRQQ